VIVSDLEAKAHGADVILLIAAVLNKNQIKELSELLKAWDLKFFLKFTMQKNWKNR